MQFKSGESPHPIQLDYFDEFGGRNSDLTICWQMMEHFCVALLLFEVWEGRGGQQPQGRYASGVGGYLAPDSEVALL